MDWKEQAIDKLKNSLYPVPAELNEIDWKTGLSPKSERLAQHISAFANQKGGGFLVFGVKDNGSHFSLQKEEVDSIIQLLGNVAQNNLVHSVKIEHCVINFEGDALLFIYIPEQIEKPVYLRGKDIFQSYNRSAGQTVKMSRTGVQFLISTSHGISFEEQIARGDLDLKDVFKLLDYKSLYRCLDRNMPQSSDSIIEMLEEHKFIKQEGDKWSITNLGAILLALNINDFQYLKGRAVRVLCYKGTNNRELIKEQIGQFGYAAGFEGLIKFILNNIRQEEIIKDALRKNEPIYPRVTIREFVANALVHQDFGIMGMPISIEIYSDRIAITNPGAPLNDVNRFIDLPPHSRNEQLAQSLLLLKICERRGSGVDRAIAALEEKKLPPVKITKGESFTKVMIYGPRKLSDMTKEEKIRACYQHACLLYEDNLSMTNQSLRERLGISKNNSSIASRIISDTIEAGYIKISDPTSESKKFVSYIPHYA